MCAVDQEDDDAVAEISSDDENDGDENEQFADVNVSVATALVQLAFEKPVKVSFLYVSVLCVLVFNVFFNQF